MSDEKVKTSRFTWNVEDIEVESPKKKADKAPSDKPTKESATVRTSGPRPA